MNPASAVPAQARRAAHEAGPWIVRLARLGFLASALLYITVGVLATSVALRMVGAPAPTEGKTTGSHGAMSTLVGAPFGRVLLGVIAIGLFGYATWRLIEAIMDPEHRGHGLKGIVTRVGYLGVAAIHVGLGYAALRLAMGHAAGGQEGEQRQHWTSRALATTGGTYVLYAIAVGLAVYGAYQLYCAAHTKLGEGLMLGTMSTRARRWVTGISRFGIAARGAVFIVTGGLVVNAVRHRDPSEAAGEAQPLNKLFELGTAPFALIAVGLIAFGVYQLINARFRRIQVA